MVCLLHMFLTFSCTMILGIFYIFGFYVVFISLTASPAHQQRIFMFQDIQKFTKLLKYGMDCIYVDNVYTG